MRLFNKGLFYALLVLLVWLPLPLASNRPWAFTILIVIVNSLVVIWLLGYLTKRVQLPPVVAKSSMIFVVWLLWLMLLILQLIPLPITWLDWLSPQSAEWHRIIQPNITMASITMDRYATSNALLLSLSYVGLFFLILVLVSTRQRLYWLALTLVMSGFIQALYGSMMTLSGLEYGFFHEKVHYRHVVTGTFINRNHAANYIAMCLAVGIGLLLAQLQGGAWQSGRQLLRHFLAWCFSWKILLRLVLIIMVIGLILTRSRMGNMAFVISLLTTGLLFLSLSKQRKLSIIIMLISLILVDIIVIGAWFGVEQVIERLQQTSFTHESRDEVSAYSVKYWLDYLWFGSGLGSYYNVFPHYQGADVNLYYSDAHNDYLQFAAETGSVGVIILGIILLMTLINALSALYQRRNRLCRGIAFGVIMAIMVLLLHSTVDFSLQIPANAATFVVILALGWIALYLPLSKYNLNITHYSAALFGKGLLISVMLLSIYTSYLAIIRGWTDMVLHYSRHQISQQQWQSANQLLSVATEWNAQCPELWELLGQLHHQHAASFKNLPDQQQAYQQALLYWHTAAMLRPLNHHAWRQVMILKYHLNQMDNQFYQALSHTIDTAPWSAYNQQIIIKISLASWHRLEPKSQHLMVMVMKRALQQQPEITQKLIRQSAVYWMLCYDQQLCFD